MGCSFGAVFIFFSAVSWAGLWKWNQFMVKHQRFFTIILKNLSTCWVLFQVVCANPVRPNSKGKRMWNAHSCQSLSQCIATTGLACNADYPLHPAIPLSATEVSCQHHADHHLYSWRYKMPFHNRPFMAWQIVGDDLVLDPDVPQIMPRMESECWIISVSNNKPFHFWCWFRSQSGSRNYYNQVYYCWIGKIVRTLRGQLPWWRFAISKCFSFLLPFLFISIVWLCNFVNFSCLLSFSIKYFIIKSNAFGNIFQTIYGTQCC